MRRLVLASTSKIRAKILADAGLLAFAVAPGVSEDPGATADPAALAEALSLRKAHAVAVGFPDDWVVGCDQVVHDPEVPGVWWGKPTDPEDHLARLKGLRGRWHELLSGWCVVGPEGVQSGVERVRLLVRADVEDEELAAYVASGEGSGCAGGYAVEGRGAFLFARVDGDWNTILGLPLFTVLTALRERGWRAR